MATIGLASEDANVNTALSAVLTELGHTVTTKTVNEIIADDTLFDALNLVIFVSYRTDDLTGNALATIVNQYSTTHGIPVLLGAPKLNTPGFDANVAELNTLAVALGLIASEINKGVPAVTQLVELETDAAAHPAVSGMEFLSPLVPSFLADEELDDSVHGTALPGNVGGSTYHWNRWGSSVAADLLSVAPYASTPIAGRTLLRADDLAVAVCANAGESRLPGTGLSATFAENIAWCGYINWSSTTETTNYGRQARAFLAGIISWLLGNQDQTTYFAAGASRVIGIDCRELGTYVSSAVSWTATTPASTTITVEGSIDGSSWSAITSGAAFAPALSGDLQHTYAFVRISLATSNSANTPIVEDFVLRIVGTSSVVTATASYFNGGVVVWLSGPNAGMKTEIKKYFPTTAALSTAISAQFLQGTPDTIIRTTGSWLDDGWRAGMSAIITDTVANNATRVIASVSDLVLTLVVNSTVVNVTDASCTFTSLETRLAELYLPTQNDATVGDTFYFLPGCDKTMPTCRDKYLNILNFVGEPYIPGRDQILTSPDAS